MGSLTGNLAKNSSDKGYISKDDLAFFFGFDFKEPPFSWATIKAKLKINVDGKTIYHDQSFLLLESWQKIVNSFRRGKAGQLQYWSPFSGKIVTYDFDLSGFNAAYKYAKSNRCS
jgi:hypothetical protein